MDLSQFNATQDVNQVTKEKLLVYDNFKKELITNGIPIGAIKDSILTEFKARSEFSTKEFYRLSKSKKREEKILEFIDKIITPLWVKYVEKEDVYLKDLRENVDKDVFITYMAGIYISINSKNMEGRISDFIEAIVVEMFYMGIKAIKEKHPEV